MHPQTDDYCERVTAYLCRATGLAWNPPPEQPSFLYNGYYTETDMAKAPHMVRTLKDIAISATGRSRAIVFERSRKNAASINIPKEVAENQAFIEALRKMERLAR